MIKDAYGNTKSEVVDVVVKTSTLPTITALDKTVYVGDVNNLLTDASAVDDYATDIMSSITTSHSINLVDNKYTTAVTYEVTYSVTDENSNTAIKTVMKLE